MLGAILSTSVNNPEISLAMSFLGRSSSSRLALMPFFFFFFLLMTSTSDSKLRSRSPAYLSSAQLQAVAIFILPAVLNLGARFVQQRLVYMRIHLALGATRPWDTEFSVTIHSKKSEPQQASLLVCAQRAMTLMPLWTA